MTNALATWLPVDNGLMPRTAMMTLLGVLAGTGGDISLERVPMHRGTGSAVHWDETRTVSSEQGLAIELGLIRATLRLSVAETAQLFGVSRPTIYSWQNGNPINAENTERLHAIAQALERHLPLFEAQVGRVALRAIEGRSTLLQMLAQGANAHEAIGQLTDILSRETAQRERIARRLQESRTGDRGAVDLDTLD